MDLNTILIIVGIVALLALIVHGLWSNRREKSKYFDEANKFEKVSPKAHHEQAVQTEEMPQHAPQHPHHAPTQVESQVVAPENIAEPVKEKSVDDIKISIPNYDMGHRAEPIKPVRAEYDMPMPSSPKNIGQMTIEEIKAQSQSDDFEGINSSSPELREQLAELAAQGGNLETSSLFNNISPEPVSKPKQTKGYIQLYLIPEHQEEFNGVKLVQALENLGFLFGDQDMYHRHLDLSVASPVLFSIANLQQPGTFDPYNLADFSTVGIVLFMHLPSPGNNLANLRMMIRAARTLAEDLQGIVLTEEQDIFDDKAEQDYLSRVA